MRYVVACAAADTQVSTVVDDATSRINALLGSMDSVLLILDHSSVSNVYSQGKSFFCCSLANQVYTQWAATITVIALAWVAMQCALRVLSKLDTLSGVSVSVSGHTEKDQVNLTYKEAQAGLSAAPCVCLHACVRVRWPLLTTAACCCPPCPAGPCREVLPLQAVPQQGLRTRQRAHHQPWEG